LNIIEKPRREAEDTAHSRKARRKEVSEPMEKRFVQSGGGCKIENGSATGDRRDIKAI
jgi:hypothetical protein